MLTILLWEAELLCPDESGNIGSVEILSVLRRKVLHLRMLRMKKITEELEKALGQKTLQEFYSRAGIRFSSNLFEYTAEGQHPIVESLNHTGMELYESLSLLQELSDSDDLLTSDVWPQLREFEYLPLPHMVDHFKRTEKDVNKLKLKTHSEIVLLAYKNLRADQPVVVQ
jgi:hypothetical protein